MVVGPEEKQIRKKHNMKKLMFAAATAAMIGSVSAAEYYDGGKCGAESCAKAYNVTVTLKTTMPDAKTKKIAGCGECEPDEYECTLYYKQGTLKLAGLAWGEADCEACDFELGDNFALWSTSLKQNVDGALALQIRPYDAKGKKAEAYGTLTGDFGQVMLAGFGSMNTKLANAGTKCEPDETCTSYVKSLSGNAAGFIARDFFDPDGDYAECEAPLSCCEEDPLQNGAASGTWKVSYNSGISKKLAKALGNESEDLESIMKFPKYFDLEESSCDISEEAVLIEE